MKNLIKLLKYLSILFFSLSFFFLVFSFFFLLSYDNSVGFKDSINNIYFALSKFNEIYKFTFVVCAFWATLRQLELSKSSYEKTLKQIQFVENDILDKRNKDIINETLNQCNLYFEVLQKDYKEIMESKKINSIPLNWTNLQSITHESLRQNYSFITIQIDEIDRDIKNNILLILYKYEAFSTIFIHGNLDKELAKKIIGETFIRQVALLLGIVAYFREDDESVFGINIIKLYNEWYLELNQKE